MHCPLCENENTASFFEDESGHYHQCQTCFLVFLDPSLLLSSSDEKKRYDLHVNDIEDAGYKEFLNKIFTPMTERIRKGSQGLEYGCGPGPLLYIMFYEAGYQMQKYDIYYANTPEVLREKYDFISMTEVIEHLYTPHSVLKQLRELLKPEGILGVMTNLYSDVEMFASWWYKKDPTHVSFFHVNTLKWIADHYEMELEVVEKNVFLFKVR